VHPKAQRRRGTDGYEQLGTGAKEGEKEVIPKTLRLHFSLLFQQFAFFFSEAFAAARRKPLRQCIID